ncbi:hypothetical protein L6452_01012 [Arctium lappa]|uniref:Uncharacterized protein n=1 Tax=Arctium lappa TaxID=4217 RepID=A0ACB9FEZ7_ARCLA|nr:hypothetical protein L6452_01012 [Arctium lappa]
MKLSRNFHLFLFLFSLVITVSVSQTTITKATNVTKPGCKRQCGNVTIPYPFGIGPGCFTSDWFEITCNTTFNPHMPFIDGLEILDISDSTFRIRNKVASKCYDQHGNITENNPVFTNLVPFPDLEEILKHEGWNVGMDHGTMMLINMHSSWTTSEMNVGTVTSATAAISGWHRSTAATGMSVSALLHVGSKSIVVFVIVGCGGAVCIS